MVGLAVLDMTAGIGREDIRDKVKGLGEASRLFRRPRSVMADVAAVAVIVVGAVVGEVGDGRGRRVGVSVTRRGLPECRGS